MNSVLVIQTAAQKQEAKAFRECFAVADAFNRHGWQATITGAGHEPVDRLDYSSFDVIFCLEQYSWGGLPDMTQIKGPTKLYWCIDLHYQGPKAYVPKTHGYDFILHSSSRFMRNHKTAWSNHQHIWFPNAVNDKLFYDRQLPKDGDDLLFVASDHPDRRVFLKQMKRYGLKFVTTLGEDMVERISRCKVHLNKSIRHEPNYRNFETIGLGACLLTENMEELSELGFIHGENCLTYFSPEDCIAKANEAIQSGSYVEIGKRAAEFAKQHTYYKRVGKLLTQI
jgi:spore maturation protein CgeB